MTRLFLFLICALPAAPSAPLAAQEGGAWNGARALELVRRAQERRTANVQDTALADYQADARGYVYFYLDRKDTGERSLVKTDQVALEVFWKAPAQAKQRIVGLRDEKALPTTIHYHLDHLSVVQDNFGDRIRLGDGDEVRDVLHPAAPGAESFYEYRVADSMAIRLPGAGEPVRVYEVQVRPRDLSRPAFLGSVFVEQRRGDLVRMDFTFTPASYVDQQLDYINISLDNGLWKERFWLPNEQRVEIRRQLPELDFPAGGVIRGTMRVSGYRFNQGLPDALFQGPPVVAVSRAQREAFPFEEGIHEELREEGIGPTTELSEIRRQALQLARARMLSGLPRVRLDVASASGVVRYNRAEGPVLGAGVVLRPSEALSARLRGGYAFGAEHPLGEVEVAWRTPELGVTASAYANRPRELGGVSLASGVLNTLSSLFAGEDYTDLFYAGGAALGVERPLLPGWTLGAGVRAERQRSARLESGFSVFGGDFRPVRPIDEGTLLGGGVELRRTAPADAARAWTLAVRAEGGVLDRSDVWRADGPLEVSDRWLRPRAEAGWLRRWAPADALLELEGAAGIGFGELPVQERFYLGGRGTVPGFALRSFSGDHFALGRATASADLARPWARGRLFGAAGWTGLHGENTTDGVRFGVGAGLGLFYDILRVDLARGLGKDGRWELIVETRPSFWDFL